MDKDSQALSTESFSRRLFIRESQDGSFRAYLADASSNKESSMKIIASSSSSYSSSSSNEFSSSEDLDAQTFNFPTTQFHLDYLSHADDLFSNGLFTVPSLSSSSSPVLSDSVMLQTSTNPSVNLKCRKGCLRLCVRFLRQYLGRFHPSTCCAINGGTSCKSMHKGKFDRTSVYSCGGGERSDNENSVLEAIIYCKQSWENK